MNKEFKASHFSNIEELLNCCDMWIKDEDYDAYCRWFDMGAMEEIVNYISYLRQALNEIKKYTKQEINDCLKKAGPFVRADTNQKYKCLNDILQIIDKYMK